MSGPWRDMTPEEREAFRRDFIEGVRQAGEASVRASAETMRQLRDLAEKRDRHTQWQTETASHEGR
jgi:hypothetical protein